MLVSDIYQTLVGTIRHVLNSNNRMSAHIKYSLGIISRQYIKEEDSIWLDFNNLRVEWRSQLVYSQDVHFKIGSVCQFHRFFSTFKCLLGISK